MLVAGNAGIFAASESRARFDVLGQFTQATNAATWTATDIITYATNADLLLVAVGWEEDTATLDSVVIDPAGANVSLTRLSGSLSANGNNKIECFYMLASSLLAGGVARTIEATLSEATQSGYIFAQTFVGATQSAPTNIAVGNSNDTSVTVSGTGHLDDSALISFADFNTGNQTYSVSAGWRKVAERTDTDGGQSATVAHRGPLTADGDLSITWTRSGTANRNAANLIEVRAA